MGLDIYVWREEVLESKRLDDGGNMETLIKKTDVYRDKGWAIGQLLQDTFDLDNCKKEGIDLSTVYEEITEGVKNYDRNDEDAQNEGYLDSVKVLLEVLAEGKEHNSNENNTYAEYFWELWW